MKWIFCLAFVLGNSIGIFAQTTDDTENKFFAALDKANDRSWFLHSSPYRAIHTGELSLKFNNADSVKQFGSYKTILETNQKIGTHAVYELSRNSVQKKYESITIRGKDGKYFERNDNGDWLQVEKLSRNVEGELYLRTSKEYKKIQEASANNQKAVNYKYLGREEINDQTADVFMAVEKLAETSKKIVTTETRKFWFAPDGKILKLDRELIIENRVGFSRAHYTQNLGSG